MSALLYKDGQATPVTVGVACQGAAGDWRVTHKRRSFVPVAFDARADNVWIVCRPTVAGTPGLSVEVGSLVLLACEEAVVVAAWTPEAYAHGLTSEWTGGTLVPKGGDIGRPTPEIATETGSAALMIPRMYERSAMSEDDDDYEETDESDDESDESREIDEEDTADHDPIETDDEADPAAVVDADAEEPDDDDDELDFEE
jgi:hypothetical protein